MNEIITQDMAYSQSLMKYAAKYGVSRASRKCNKSRSYTYFWMQRWDGSVASLACQSILIVQYEKVLHFGFLRFAGRIVRIRLLPAAADHRKAHCQRHKKHQNLSHATPLCVLHRSTRNI